MKTDTPGENLFEETRMSFGEHLEELRKVLFKCLICVALGCVVGFANANAVVRLLTAPLVSAMGDYLKAEAIENRIDQQGYVDPELYPWLNEERMIPQQTYIDPVMLVSALRTILPDFAAEVTIDPYGFRPDNFRKSQLPPMAKSLIEAGDPGSATGSVVKTETKSPSELKTESDAGQDVKLNVGSATTSNADPASDSNNAKRLPLKPIWNLLSSTEQDQLKRIAKLPAATDADLLVVANAFSRLASEEMLYELTEYQSLISEVELSWWEQYLPPPPIQPMVKMNQEYQRSQDFTIARRLNRALLSHLFAEHLQNMKTELVPVEIWERSDFQPQALGVTETFMVWLKAGILTGITVAAPFIFYFLWTFVAAGLYPHEQKYVYIYLPISIGLFVCGVLMVFLFVFEPVLQFLFSFNRQMGIAPQMRINDWLSFVMFLPIGFGLAFQLPLVMLFMNRIGLFQASDYIKKWRIAVMVIFVLSMFLTPQDPISLLMLAVPLTLLYFIGVGMCIWMPSPKNPFAEPDHQYKIV